MPRLEDFTPGAQVKGILAGSPVTVVSVKWHGSNALVLTYKDGERKPDVTLLYRDNEPALEILQPGRHRKFSKVLSQKNLRIRSEALLTSSELIQWDLGSFCRG